MLQLLLEIYGQGYVFSPLRHLSVTAQEAWRLP